MSVRRRWALCVAWMMFVQFGSLVVAHAAPPRSNAPPGHRVGLGNVLTTADGGQIFGWDLNQHGTDGVLTTSQDVDQFGTYKVSVETFDQTTATITSSFARHTGKRHAY